MLVVDTGPLLGSEVVLADFFVAAAHEEVVLFVVVGMELGHIGVVFEMELADYFSVLSVPIVDEHVVAGREEVESVVAEVDVSDGLRVSHVGPDTLAVGVDVPELDLAVHRAAQEEVSVLGVELQPVHALRVALVLVDLLLRNVAGVLLQLQLAARQNVGLALVVGRTLQVKLSLNLQPDVDILLLLVDLLLPLLLYFAENFLVVFQNFVLTHEQLLLLVACPGPFEVAAGDIVLLVPFLPYLSLLLSYLSAAALQR